MRTLYPRTIVLVGLLALPSLAPAAVSVNRLPASKAAWGTPVDMTLSTATAMKIGSDLAESTMWRAKIGETAAKYAALTEDDKRLEPDYAPPGAPAVPSKCVEDTACKPCYSQAYEHVDKTRRDLEKVRAHYDYTHRFSAEGKALMQGVGGAAGNLAAMGAMEESTKVDTAVSAFDEVVRNKNAELLARLQDNLREVARCEAQYYDNEDWYDRYGYMYYQFMSAHYGYAGN